MSKDLFYSEIQENRGGFLRSVFEICSKTGKRCGHCGFATYNPEIRDYDGKKREFCGVASSYDTRVSSLPECWFDMTKSQRATYAKNKKIELQGLEIRGE
jgi:hypothetical protein|tara:strand:+ start:482 stop:781 length:300 start_codon:yes stop_codon:yes gene_type:complete